MYIIVDGGYLFHNVSWSSQSTFQDILDLYLQYVEVHFGHSAAEVFLSERCGTM